MWNRFEEMAGGAITYTVAAANVGVGAWVGENWYLVLSAIAVIIRIFIDVQTYRRNRKHESK